MPLSTDEIAQFTAQINANKRVDLYDKNYLIGIKWVFPLLLLGTLISFTLLFSMGLMTQSELILYSVIALIGLFLVQLILRHVRIATLKGDTLILKCIHSKSTVMSLRSVRKARSYRFIGLNLTLVRYSLDKKPGRIIVFGAPSGMSTSLDNLLISAKNYKKK